MNAVPLCSNDVMDAIERHALGETTREVGGVLVGVVRSDGLVEIRAALPALRATAEQTHVTFTHEVWEEILPAVDREYPDCRIVGWYHSHPGFGVFLSDYDTFICDNFFSDQHMVALVVDPLSGQSGWFGWSTGGIRLTKTFTMLNPPAQAGAEAGAAAQARRSGRNTVVLATALAAVIGLGVGYGVAAFSGGGDDSKSVARGAVTDGTQVPATVPEVPATVAPVIPSETPAPAPEVQPAPEAVPAPGQVMTYIHTVREGETLWRLADVIYGDGARYKELEADNPGLDPARLPVGSTVEIRIPKEQWRFGAR